MTTESGRSGIYSRISPWLGKYGVPMRIENAIASGLPDTIYAAKGNLIWIELKVVNNDKIELRRFQFAYASRCIPYLNPQFFWFLCADKTYNMYMWQTLRPHMKGLEVTMTGIKPDHVLYSEKSVEGWLSLIKNHIPM